MVNLITRMVSMEIVWGHCGDGYFYGDFVVKLILEIVWSFHGENMVN